MGRSRGPVILLAYLTRLRFGYMPEERGSCEPFNPKASEFITRLSHGPGAVRVLIYRLSDTAAPGITDGSKGPGR